MRTTTALAGLAFLVGFPQFGFAQPDAKKGEPLDKLPRQVQAARGELTLFADFAAKTDKGVPVYIVNRTGKPLTFFTQDGDIFVKLEYEATPGNWVRAQPHAFSDCGLSYVNRPELANDTWMVVTGYLPKEGDRVPVRYGLYHQVVKVHSNRAMGLVNKDDVRRASGDALAVKSGDFDFLRRVALGEVKLKNELDHLTDLRGLALHRLASEASFERAAVERVLQTLADRRDEPLANMAAQYLETFRSKPRKPK